MSPLSELADWTDYYDYDDPICDCGYPGYACRCAEREAATLAKLRSETWRGAMTRRVGHLGLIETGPEPCRACDGSGVVESRRSAGICARCKGKGEEGGAR